jgi:hypothetical protein
VRTRGDEIADLLQVAKTIAVVGCSKNPQKEAHTVPLYMKAHGYRVLPVNPTADEIFGQKAFDVITEIDEPVDIVCLFRPGPECDQVVEQALKISPGAIWLQLGITNKRAKDLAEAAGVRYFEDLCLRMEHQRVTARIDPSRR